MILPDPISDSPIQESTKGKKPKRRPQPVMWICIGLNAVPDPALIAIRICIWIQEAKPIRIYADPDPGQTYMSQKAF
jgi:hypothetical protein